MYKMAIRLTFENKIPDQNNSKQKTSDLECINFWEHNSRLKVLWVQNVWFRKNSMATRLTFENKIPDQNNSKQKTSDSDVFCKS